MTDDQLNRLIAEKVMEWTRCQCNRQCEIWYKDGVSYTVPNYCTDPAAWASLFVWLAVQTKPRRYPRIGQERTGEPDGSLEFTAAVNGATGYFRGYDSMPGRALVLATLAAYGVEVTE